MGTHSAIILKVRKEDIGKKVKFSAKKLPKETPLEDWVDDGKEFSEEVELKGEYIGIYCHWDGYTEGVGNALRNHFNDYDTILNLIVGGFCSAIGEDGVRHYANRNGEEWKWIEPSQGTLDEVKRHIDWEYVYIFDNDKWICENDEDW